MHRKAFVSCMDKWGALAATHKADPGIDSK